MMFTTENYGYGFYLVRCWETRRVPYESASWIQLGDYVEFSV